LHFLERSEVSRFSSRRQPWFKKVNLAPKEKVRSETGNEMKFYKALALVVRF